MKESLLRGFSDLLGYRVNIETLRSKKIDEGSLEALALSLEKYSAPHAIKFFLNALGTSANEIGIDPFIYKDCSQLEGILLYIMDFRR